jgi:O-succinylbenzoate synthase
MENRESESKFPVEAIELRIVRLPLVQPFRTSFGKEHERLTVIASVSSGGRTGFGEAPVARLPGYCYETAGTAFHVLADVFAPRVAGLEIGGPEGLAVLWKGLKGHPLARAGLEAAVWDLGARIQGKPLREQYGGTRDRIEVGVSVGIQDSVQALLQRVGEYRSQGYGRIKIKLEPGWDVGTAKAVRQEFPDVRLWGDANQAFGRDDLERLKGLREARLELLEQPLHEDDLLGHAQWQEELGIPICLDESVGSEADLENAIALRAMAVLNLKPARVGGNLAAIRIAKRCAEAGIPVWCGGLLETGIGRAHNVALASRPEFTMPGDLSASGRYFERDLVSPPFELGPGSTLEVPSGEGLGREVDVPFLDSVTVRRAVVRA